MKKGKQISEQDEKLVKKKETLVTTRGTISEGKEKIDKKNF